MTGLIILREASVYECVPKGKISSLLSYLKVYRLQPSATIQKLSDYRNFFDDFALDMCSNYEVKRRDLAFIGGFATKF